MRFAFQYIREQRCYFVVEAADLTEARNLAEEKANTFDLHSVDDESDDPGEIIQLEGEV